MNPWIPIVISAIATLISLLGYLRNRPKLIQIRKTSSKMYEPIVEGQIGAEYFEHEKIQLTPLPAGIIIHLAFLNTSPSDISYFSIGFYEKVSRNETRLVECYTRQSLLIDNPTLKFIYSAPNGDFCEIYFPKNTYGLFKAHSYTPLWFFMPLRPKDKIPKKIKFNLNYAMRSFPFFGKNSYTKKLTIKLNLSNLEKELIEQQELMQDMPNQMKSESLKSPSHLFKKKTKANNVF